MNITIHIERLVLDGLPVTLHDAPSIQAAVEAELARLLARRSGMQNFHRSFFLSAVRGGAIQLSPNVSPSLAGKQIAGTIHSAVWESELMRNSGEIATPRKENRGVARGNATSNTKGARR